MLSLGICFVYRYLVIVWNQFLPLLVCKVIRNKLSEMVCVVFVDVSVPRTWKEEQWIFVFVKPACVYCVFLFINETSMPFSVEVKPLSKLKWLFAVSPRMLLCKCFRIKGQKKKTTVMYH